MNGMEGEISRLFFFLSKEEGRFGIRILKVVRVSDSLRIGC